MNSHKHFVSLSGLAFACLAGLLGAVSPCDAQDNKITMNFDLGTSTSPLFQAAGADQNDAGTIWNRIVPDSSGNIAASGLLDSTGHGTQSVLSISGVDAVDTTGGDNLTDNQLLEDYVVGRTNTIYYSITKLPPLTRFQCYFYCAGSQSGQGAKVVSGSMTATTSATARGSTFVEGVNYVTITGGADDSGTLLGHLRGSSDNASIPVLNGFQIQQDTLKLVTPPSFVDAFDISQGTVVLNHSLMQGQTDTQPGRPAESALGGIAPKPYPTPSTAFFAPRDPNITDFIDFIEFQMMDVKTKMPSVKTIRSISLYTSASINPFGAAKRITLWAYNPSTAAYDIKAFEVFPANPYALTVAPPGSAVQNTGDSSTLALTANITPVTTDRFRIELQEGPSGPTAGGNITELDGFTDLNPGLPNAAPIITTATSTTGQVGTALTFQLAATGSPTSYVADGLPPGLTLDAATGVISGIPTMNGGFDAAVGAKNDGGLGPIATLHFTISPRAEDIQGVTILSPPAEINVVAGNPINIYAAVQVTPGTLQTLDFIVLDASGTEVLHTSSQLARASTNWSVPTTSDAADYTLEVVATDINGLSKSFQQAIHAMPVSFQSTANIRILNAPGSAPFALGSSVKVIGFAADGNGNAPTNAQFYLDGQPLPTTLIAGDTASRLAAGSPNGGAYYAADVPANAPVTLLSMVEVDDSGISSLATPSSINTRPAQLGAETVSIQTPTGAPLSSGDTAPSSISVALRNPARSISRVDLFASDKAGGTKLVGSLPASSIYNFDLSALSPGQTVLTAIATGADGVADPSPALLLSVPPPVTAPVISGSLSPSIRQGTAFAYQITASNGPTSYSQSGLPAGLSLNTSTGKITGAPTVFGTFKVTLKATNSGGTGTATLSLAIKQGVPEITSSLTPPAREGVGFTYQITAKYNPTSYKISSLPPGLSFDTMTGKLTGVPSKAGTYKPLVSAINGGGTGSANLNLVVKTAVPVITSSLNPSARQDVSFAYQVTASHNPTSYKISSLPPGLSFNTTTGKLAGVPSKAGTYRPLISAINGGGTGSANLNLVVKAAVPVITSSLNPPARQGASFSYQIVATHSPTSYGASGLPAGLSVSTSTGKIAGKPTKAGTYKVTIKAINNAGTGTKMLTLVVKPPA